MQISAATVQQIKDDVLRETCAIMEESLRKLKDDFTKQMRVARGQNFKDLDFVLGHFANFGKSPIKVIETIIGKKTTAETKRQQDEMQTAADAAREGQQSALYEFEKLGFNITQIEIPDEEPPSDEER